MRNQTRPRLAATCSCRSPVTGVCHGSTRIHRRDCDEDRREGPTHPRLTVPTTPTAPRERATYAGVLTRSAGRHPHCPESVAGVPPTQHRCRAAVSWRVSGLSPRTPHTRGRGAALTLSRTASSSRTSGYLRLSGAFNALRLPRAHADPRSQRPREDAPANTEPGRLVDCLSISPSGSSGTVSGLAQPSRLEVRRVTRTRPTDRGPVDFPLPYASPFGVARCITGHADLNTSVRENLSNRSPEPSASNVSCNPSLELRPANL